MNQEQGSVKVVYTVCNRKELAGAILLGVRVNEYMPEVKYLIGWVDEGIPEGIPDYIEIIPWNIFVPEAWQQMGAAYSETELLAACRPFVALHLFQKTASLTRLTFFAPSTCLYRSFEDMTGGDGADMLLTPHITGPAVSLPDAPDDKRILNIGMFHSGAWTIRKSDDTLAFLKWWTSRTKDRARLDLCEGMCLDQLWLNYAPVFLPETYIVPEASWHVGLHNLSRTRLTENDGDFLADGKALISADFCGMLAFHPVWTRHKASGLSDKVFRMLLERYQSDLKPYNRFNFGGNPAYGSPILLPAMEKQRRFLTSGLKRLNKWIDTFNI